MSDNIINHSNERKTPDGRVITIAVAGTEVVLRDGVRDLA